MTEITQQEFVKQMPNMLRERIKAVRSISSDGPNSAVVFLLFVTGAVLACLVPFFFFRLFSPSPQQRRIRRLTRRMTDFIHSRVRPDGTGAAPVSESDLRDAFHSDPSLNNAIHALMHTVDRDLDYNGDSWVSRVPRYPLKCRVAIWRLLPALSPETLAAAAIAVVVIIVAALIVLWLLGRSDDDRDAAFLVREMVKNSQRGTRQFEPGAVRAHFAAGWSERKWNSVQDKIEKNPIVCVLKKVDGAVWRVML
jgi:hypothetical protein